MKIITVLGTRPEMIRLSRIIPKLDAANHVQHVLVHTGQNSQPSLRDIFFSELNIRQPDYCLEIKGQGMANQIGQILSQCEEIFKKEKPDRLLVLGDTNSSLSTFIAKRLGILVLHMEAGNRCFDDRVPEEVNRRVIDTCSDIHMPYTERSRQNLLQAGFPSHRIFVVGNPIYEVIEHERPRIEQSSILQQLKVHPKGYFLVTYHRAENVDIEERLKAYIQAFEELSVSYQKPVLVSTHPRTWDRMKAFNIQIQKGDVRFLDPFGFHDFMKLELNALCVLTDSGTVQEECSLYHIPNATLRDVTERPETVECGSNIILGPNKEEGVAAVKMLLDMGTHWIPPLDYTKPCVSDTVTKIVTGYHHF